MQLVKVWGEDLPKLREKIINLWVNEGVLSKEEANKRVNEVICAALDDNLEVMAICSGSPIYSEQLKEWFLYYRHFTSSKFRAQKLRIDLYYAAKEFFNNISIARITKRTNKRSRKNLTSTFFSINIDIN